MPKSKVVETIKKTLPAVVSIVISKNLADLEKEIPQELYPFLPSNPEGRHLNVPESLIDKRGMVQIGGGSGFIVEPEGVILTNKHVISDPKAEYTVVLSSGAKYPARVLSRDPVNDVAVIKIVPLAAGPRGIAEKVRLPTIALGDAARVELGVEVLAIGNALGLFKNTVSLGIVSGLARSIAAQEEPDAAPQELRGLIQTDAAINPGNSGGPLVTLDGKTIGINTAIVFGAQNIGFAIPINAARRDLHDLKTYGRIRKPLLGVRYLIVDENLQGKMNLPVSYGALIVPNATKETAIVPDSPAAKAGLKEMDIILECNATKVDHEHAIQDFLEKLDVGSTLDLLVLRGNKRLNVKVTLAERK
ncbi:MAG: trypsin-like peptidase domain-containing protein [Candidatus Liptonbacteria bacterium]|nr:trypsin-like peptidase domain-containing protein [Candidatus Liptonbacteria bacterium]